MQLFDVKFVASGKMLRVARKMTRYVLRVTFDFPREVGRRAGDDAYRPENTNEKDGKILLSFEVNYYC